MSRKKELCLHYGEKIPLEQGTFLLGGNACNVAVGMSRLGFRSALIAELGSAECAQKIRAGLQAEGVSGDYLQQTDSGSSFSTALNFAGERKLFVRHVERKHAFAYDGLRTPWLYITSLGVSWRPAYPALLDFAKQADSREAIHILGN
jgi:sugar/nucleoside kinase (ribokinase family)